MDFDYFLSLISRIENAHLGGFSSHAKMVPKERKLIHLDDIETANPRMAAVLALFYPDKSNLTNFVLILRANYDGTHSSQISFPGGKFEEGDDSLEMTAKRETFEEVGIPMDDIEVLQEMTKIYIPPSNFHVQPYLGITKKTPKFVKQEDEVKAVIEVPLQHFMDDKVVITKRVSTSYSISVNAPAFELNDHIVWGATAMMLSEIKDLLKALL